MKRGWAMLWGLAIGVGSAHGLAGEELPKPSPSTPTHPLSGLGRNLASSFTGWNLALHASGIGATPLMVQSGMDTDLHNFFARHQGFEPYSAPGVYGGYIAPVLLASSFYGVGILGKSQREMDTANALVQATLLAVSYQTLLKAVTGRPPPDPEVYEDDSASHRFRFGLLRGGVHFGWPSGHLMTSSALLVTLLRMYPDSWILWSAGSATWGYVLASVAVHESCSMHWPSDMLAGTLMGIAIGNGVGEGFSSPWLRRNGIASRMQMVPMTWPRGGVGLGLFASF